MSRPPLWLSAVHESAHAVVCVVEHREFECIALQKGAGSWAYTAMWNLSPTAKRPRVEADVRVMLAGGIAESRARGVLFLDWTCGDDLDEATRRTRRRRLDLMALVAQTVGILEAHWCDVLAVAAVLVDERRLTAHDVRLVLRAA